MKKVFLVIACALVAISASAQFKIEAGAGLGGYSKMSGFTNGAGFFANALYDIDLGASGNENYFLETGVGFLANNIKDNSNGSKVNTSWIKIPVLFGSDFVAGNGYLTAAIGLYYARGIAGSISNGGVSLNVMGDIFKQNDFGFEGKLGYTFSKGFGLFVSYEHGLANIAAQANSEAKTNVLSFGLSYKFF